MANRKTHKIVNSTNHFMIGFRKTIFERFSIFWFYPPTLPWFTFAWFSDALRVDGTGAEAFTTA